MNLDSRHNIHWSYLRFFTEYSHLWHFLKNSSNFVDFEVRRELANSDLPPLPRQRPFKNHVGFRGTYLSMCGGNNNFTATNSDLPPSVA